MDMFLPVHWHVMVLYSLHNLLHNLLHWDGHFHRPQHLLGDMHDFFHRDRNVVRHVYATLNDFLNRVWDWPVNDFLHGIWNRDLVGLRNRDFVRLRYRVVDNLFHDLFYGIWHILGNNLLHLVWHLHWNFLNDLPWHLNDLFHNLFNWVGHLLVDDALHRVWYRPLNDLLHRVGDLDNIRDVHLTGHLNNLFNDVFHRDRLLHLLHYFIGNRDVDVLDDLYRVWDLLMHDLFNRNRDLDWFWNDHFVGHLNLPDNFSWNCVRDLPMNDFLNRVRNLAVNNFFHRVRHGNFMRHRNSVVTVHHLFNHPVHSHWEVSRNFFRHRVRFIYQDFLDDRGWDWNFMDHLFVHGDRNVYILRNNLLHWKGDFLGNKLLNGVRYMEVLHAVNWNLDVARHTMRNRSRNDNLCVNDAFVGNWNSSLDESFHRDNRFSVNGLQVRGDCAAKGRKPRISGGQPRKSAVCRQRGKSGVCRQRGKSGVCGHG